MTRSSAALALAVMLGGCVSLGSGPPDTPFNRGVDAFDQKRYADAVRFFRRATEIAPDDPRAEVNLALTFDRIGRAKQAQTHYRRALALNPEEPRALANLGQLLGDAGKTREARTLLTRATDVEPSSAYTWAALGWFELKQGKLDAADRHFAAAIDAEPEASTGHYHMGRLLEARRQPAAALERYRTAITLEPEDTEAMRAVIRLQPAGNAEAIGLMERVLLVSPDDAPMWLGLGRSYLAAGDAERAAMALWQARDRSGGAPKRLAAIHTALRRAYAALGRELPPVNPAKRP